MLKVAIIGPESSGKSTLCQDLSLHFGISFVAEYSRQYLQEIEHPYELEDLIEIAQGQLKGIESAVKAKEDLLISDTEALCVLVWSEVKYGTVSPLVSQLWEGQDFDLYLLCDASLPWEYDVLREVPDQHKRQEIFELFKKKLIQAARKFAIIQGHSEQRKNQAIAYINRCLSH